MEVHKSTESYEHPEEQKSLCLGPALITGWEKQTTKHDKDLTKWLKVWKAVSPSAYINHLRVKSYKMRQNYIKALLLKGNLLLQWSLTISFQPK